MQWDAHAHLLPGIDDGARNWEESLAMARLAVQDGTQLMYLTPHYVPGLYENTADQIRALTEEFRQRLQAAGIPLRIEPGCEIFLHPELPRRVADGIVMTYGDQGRHLLIELPPHEIPWGTEDCFFELQLQGLVPVLAHPERNEAIQDDPAWVVEMSERGVLMQVTSGAILGSFGKRAQRTARYLARQGCIDLIGSDAHGFQVRRPLISEALRLLARWGGSELAAQVRKNPLQSVG